MHVGHEEIETTVAVKVENLGAHRAPRRFGKVRRRRIGERLAVDIQPKVILPHHVQHVDVRTTVVIHIDRCCVATPAIVHEPRLLRHIGKTTRSQIAIQNARLVALRMRVSMKRIRKSDEIVARTFLVCGVNADVRDQQIEQAIAVVVEKQGAG